MAKQFQNASGKRWCHKRVLIRNKYELYLYKISILGFTGKNSQKKTSYEFRPQKKRFLKMYSIESAEKKIQEKNLSVKRAFKSNIPTILKLPVENASLLTQQ